MIKLSYDELKQVYEDRGLGLDELVDTAILDRNEKLHCHCLKHPKTNLMLSYGVVKCGRFGCPECRKEYGRNNYTIEEKKEIVSRYGYEYIDGDLTKIVNPLLIQCKQGHQFKRSINEMLRNDQMDDCPFCKGNVSMGYWCLETCQEWLNHNMQGYVLLDTKRENGDLRCYIQCPNKEHNPYWTSWNHLHNSKTMCRQCYYDREGKKDWTLDRAKNKLKEFGFTMLNEEEYVSSHRRVYCSDELGFIYSVSLHYLLRGRTKFALWRNNKYAVHNIRLYMNLFRPDYEFVSETYNQGKDKYFWKYLGELPEGVSPIFEQTVNAMINNDCGHPVIAMSGFERKCKFLLDRYNIKYKTQKTFDGCVYRIKLRFDFYIELNGIKYCIETDGGQHDMPVEKFGGIQEFEERKIKDKIKDDYCKHNGIKLIRIKYKDSKNMESILLKELGLEEYVA